MAEDLDIIETYFPDQDDIPQDKLQHVRERLTAHMHKAHPDLDARPNTPFGDWVLGPMAYSVASMEVAMGRFMSDLDLENVANGTIYNCEFVKGYLGNFAIVPRDGLGSSGVVRLTMSEDKDYIIDRGTRFSFQQPIAVAVEGASSDVENVFAIRHFHDGPLVLKAVGTSGAPGSNYRTLTEVSPGNYAVDIPVTGAMDTDALVLNGASGTTDRLLDEMQDIRALGDFMLGLPPESIPRMAERARDQVYTTTFTSRNGARHALFKEYPDLLAASAVITGDDEMLRDTVTPLGMGAGRMDLYVKSPGYRFLDSHTIKIDYDTTNMRYVAALDLQGVPCQISTIRVLGQEDVDISNLVTIYSTSDDQAKAPMLSAAYSTHEKFYIHIDMPLGGDGEPLIDNSVDPDTGDVSATFVVEYLSDPLLTPISALADSRDDMPIGVDTLVRGFVPFHIRSLDVHYVRRAGTTMALDQAREEIFEYVRGLGYPRTWSDSKIIDAMHYAGADDVKSVIAQAELRFTVADKVMKPEAPLPTVSLSGAEAASLLPYRITVSGASSNLVPHYRDINLGESDADWSSAGPRNITYLLDADDIVFTEVSP